MHNELAAQPGTISRAEPRPARRVRRAPRAVSVGLLAVATLMGVHLGLDAPTVSPVSPAAIAARYGSPPPALAAIPPADPEAAQADAASAAQGDNGRGTSQGHQRGRHDGEGHE